tara:strand:+ start:2584 stop:3369 length:786 start_codon:yes stop_codon:yes gene_type:complete
MSSAPSSPRSPLSPLPAPDFDDFDDETQMMPSPGTPPQGGSNNNALSPPSSPARNTEINMSADPTDLLNITKIETDIAQTEENTTTSGASKKKSSKGTSKGKKSSSNGAKSSSSKATKRKDAPVDDKPPVEVDESAPFVLAAIEQCVTVQEIDEEIRRTGAYCKRMRVYRKAKVAAMKPKGMPSSGGIIDLFWKHFARNEVEASFDDGVRMPIKATTNHAQKRAIAVKMWKEASDEMKTKVFNLQMEFKASKDDILSRVCS